MENNKKGIVLYESKYGATKTYAYWLKEKTGYDIMETHNADISTLTDHDVIVLGGGVYYLEIAGLSFLKQNIKMLEDKQIIVFCVGGLTYSDCCFRDQERLIENGMSPELTDIPLFYLPGVFDEKIMKKPQKAAFKKKKKGEQLMPIEKNIVMIYGKGRLNSWHRVNEKHLVPLYIYLGYRAEKTEQPQELNIQQFRPYDQWVSGYCPVCGHFYDCEVWRGTKECKNCHQLLKLR